MELGVCWIGNEIKIIDEENVKNEVGLIEKKKEGMRKVKEEIENKVSKEEGCWDEKIDEGWDKIDMRKIGKEEEKKRGGDMRDFGEIEDSMINM